MKKPTVMIVSNHPDLAESTSQALRHGRLSCLVVNSAAEALAFIRNETPPDLLIVDLHLEDIDGWRFCRVLRSPPFSATRETPIVIISDLFDDIDLAHMAAGIGAHAHLTMPCPDHMVVDTVNALLKDDASLRTPRALIVDDNEDTLRFLSAGLTAYGYNVSKAASAEEAARLFPTYRPDIVIIDHMLPDKNGLQLLTELHNIKDEQRHVIFVAITAVTDPDLAIEYSKEGIDGFVYKPFSIRQLVELITEARSERMMRRMKKLLEARTTSLRDMGARLHDLYENAPVGYHSLDRDGRVVSMNATELDWLGYTANEIIGKKTIFDLQTDDSAIIGREIFQTLLTTGELREAELTFIRKDGSHMPVQIESSAIMDEDGAFVSSRTIVRDITERKALEEQLRHAQKMDSLGTLAIGIAHNFNNLLTPIMVNASDLLEDFPDDGEEHQILEDVVLAAQRGASLVKELITLGRVALPSRDRVDLRDVVENTLRILHGTLAPNIEIKTDLDPDLPAIVGDPAQIQQALLNLCFNACEAMPNGGHLIVGLHTAEITQETTPLSALAHVGTYAVLSVTDSGEGIPDDIQEKIFDPFFTTKGLVQRSGLGLSTTYGILKDHGGFIHLYSEPNEGSKFRLYFPVDPDTAAAAGRPAPQRQVAPSLRGCEHILVVDDKIDVLRAATRILNKAGYTASAAQDGITALDILRKAAESPSPIDLAILDVVMPHMSGEQVFDRIRHINPSLPVIVASGYGNTNRVTDLLDKGANESVSKPYERNTLLRAVRKILDAS